MCQTARALYHLIIDVPLIACAHSITLQVSKSADDPYAQGSTNRPSTGTTSLGPGAAAQAAVLNAAALAGPVVIRCELCQVSSVPGKRSDCGPTPQSLTGPILV